MNATKITTGMDTKVKLSGSDRGSLVVGLTEGESQRKAEILIATLFLVSAVTSSLGIFVLDPILKGLRLSGQGFSEQGSSRIGFPAVVVQQHWDCLHRGVC